MSSKAFFDAQKLHMKGNVHDALRIYEGLLKRNPRDSRARIFYALACVQMGRSQDGYESVNKAMEEGQNLQLIDLNTAGVIYRKLGRLNEAERALTRAHELAPENGGIISNIGLIKMAKGEFESALKFFEKANNLMPEDISALLNIARIKIRFKEFQAAEELLEEAKNRNPGHSELNLLKAELSLTEANHEDAFSYLILSLQKSPANMEAWKILNKIDANCVNIDLLESCANEFVKTKSTSGRLIATVVGVLRKNLAWTHLATIEALLDSALINGKDNGIESSAAFQLLASDISQLAHKNSSSTSWSVMSSKFRHLKRPEASSLVNRKLRIGILSSDLRDHAIGYLVVSVLENHDKNKLELYAYSNSQDDGGKIRVRMRKIFDRFVNVSNLNHEEITKKIKEDRIDILVDLNGMTAETMVPCFVFKPAPVTVTWLGMPGTLGAGSDVDYVILDEIVCDAQNIDGFDEKVVLLPHCYQPNDSLLDIEEQIEVSRSKYGLPDEAFVYCSFNQHYKYSPETIKLWSKIINANSISILWILAPDISLRKRLIDVFEKYKIDRNKIIFADKAPHKEHVKRLKLADLMLDNWPYNAHTTCSDSLRAGTPIVTLPGKTFASRVAASILHNSNLSEWIATSPEEYVEIAVDIATKSRKEINQLKEKIYHSYWNSSMVNSLEFAQNLEKFYFYAYENKLNNKAIKNLKFINGFPAPFDFEINKLQSTSVYNNIKTSDEYDKYNHEINKLLIDKGIIDAKEIAALLEYKLPLVIDIGAADSDGSIGYEKFADHGLISVLGFEPSPEAFKNLSSSNYQNRKFIQSAIGNGSEFELNLCTAPGMNSLLKPNLELLDIFPMYSKWAEIKDTLKINTKKLDDFEIARPVKFLKIDVQGFEFEILKNAENILNNLSVLQLDLSPTPLYEGESSLFIIGAWLESKGYILHNFSEIIRRGLKPWFNDSSPFGACNQIFQVDAVFIPSFLSWHKLSNDRLEGIAFFMHIMYKSYDITSRAFSILDARDNGNRVGKYKEIVGKL